MTFALPGLCFTLSIYKQTESVSGSEWQVNVHQYFYMKRLDGRNYNAQLSKRIGYVKVNLHKLTNKAADAILNQMQTVGITHLIRLMKTEPKGSKLPSPDSPDSRLYQTVFCFLSVITSRAEWWEKPAAGLQEILYIKW